VYLYIYYYIVWVPPLDNLYYYTYTHCRNNKVFEYITYYSYYYYYYYTPYYIHSLLQEIDDYNDDKKYHQRVYAEADRTYVAASNFTNCKFEYIIL